MTLRILLRPSLNWLLICLPATVILKLVNPDAHTAIFLLAGVAIIPLAGWLGRATEQLAARTTEGIGGLLNATFGNAAELIITLMALHAGLYDVVKASITGSIIGNILLVMGAAFFAGGLRYKVQQFNPAGAGVQATMMTLASIALIVPAVYHGITHSDAPRREADLSLEISIVLMVTYAISLIFSLRTHRQLFAGPAIEGSGKTSHNGSWPLWQSLTVLVASTALIAWISEILVGSIEIAAHELGMTSVFVGVIVVAIIGNAAEHSTAIMAASKNRMDLSVGIAIGSSIQVALFVAPVLVFASYVIGPRPMDLVFTPMEVVAIALAVLITGEIARDGQSNWLEGVQLLSVYLIFGLVFYFLPA